MYVIPVIKWDPLQPPSNGNVTVISDDHSVGSEATYACEYEYQQHGLNSTRLCQLVSGSSTEAEWTGQHPTCQREYFTMVGSGI